MNIDSLKTQHPDLIIKSDPQSLETYGRDWTKHFTPKPMAIAFPRTTEEVQDLVNWARKNQVAIVPSGGRTGLSAAAYATQGELVVSFEKMNRVLEFDPVDQTLTCEAGVVTEDLQNYAKEKGLLYPVDFAARGSSQIGGNVATNAGGIKVIRYGLTRQWVTGLKVVTGAGEILQLNNSLVKNASGYDLRHLFIGSEGTLGLITEVTVKLAQPPKNLQVYLLAVNELLHVMEIYKTYMAKLPVVAFEMFTDVALKYIHRAGHVKCPIETNAPYYLLVEIEEANEEVSAKSMSVFEACMEQEWVVDGAMAQNSQQAIDIWKLREDITEATSEFQPYKNDVSVRVSKVPLFLQEMDAILKRDYPDFDVVWFGHIGDGNLHINVLKPQDLTSEEFMKRCLKVDEELFGMIEKHGGSVSAEHGVGLVKKPHLLHTRSQVEIDLMKGIKKVFDPDGILNPGKIFDA